MVRGENKGKVVNVEVCEAEELCEGTGEPISKCQCNVCTSNKPVLRNPDFRRFSGTIIVLAYLTLR